MIVQQGPSSKLISHIHNLAELLKNLPIVLLLDPMSLQYGFGLDTELVEKKGVWFVFNRNLEVCFETHKLVLNGTIVFHNKESGMKCSSRCSNLLSNNWRRTLNKNSCAKYGLRDS